MTSMSSPSSSPPFPLNISDLHSPTFQNRLHSCYFDRLCDINRSEQCRRVCVAAEGTVQHLSRETIHFGNKWQQLYLACAIIEQRQQQQGDESVPDPKVSDHEASAAPPSEQALSNESNSGLDGLEDVKRILPSPSVTGVLISFDDADSCVIEKAIAFEAVHSISITVDEFYIYFHLYLQHDPASVLGLSDHTELNYLPLAPLPTQSGIVHPSETETSLTSGKPVFAFRVRIDSHDQLQSHVWYTTLCSSLGIVDAECPREGSRMFYDRRMMQQNRACFPAHINQQTLKQTSSPTVQPVPSPITAPPQQFKSRDAISSSAAVHPIVAWDTSAAVASNEGAIATPGTSQVVEIQKLPQKAKVADSSNLNASNSPPPMLSLVPPARSAAPAESNPVSAIGKSKVTRALALLLDFNGQHLWWLFVIAINIGLFLGQDWNWVRTNSIYVAVSFLMVCVLLRDPITLFVLFNTWMAILLAFNMIPSPSILCGSQRLARLLEYIRGEVKYYVIRLLNCIGGLHSGCGISAIVWFSIFIKYTMHDLALLEYGNSRIVVTILACCSMMISALFAYPSVRIYYHDTFEVVHRVCGWCTLICFLIYVGLDSHASYDPPIAVGKTYPFWVLVSLAFLAVWPWLRTVKVMALVDVPVHGKPGAPIPDEPTMENVKAGAAAIVRVPDYQYTNGWRWYGTGTSFTGSKISFNNWEYHSFATSAEASMKAVSDEKDAHPSAVTNNDEEAVVPAASGTLDENCYVVKCRQPRHQSLCDPHIKPLDRHHFNLLIARAGDWTGRLIDHTFAKGSFVRDTHGWRKRCTMPIYLRRYHPVIWQKTTLSYKRVLYFCTGGGISGPMPLIADEARIHRNNRFDPAKHDYSKPAHEDQMEQQALSEEKSSKAFGEYLKLMKSHKFTLAGRTALEAAATHYTNANIAMKPRSKPIHTDAQPFRLSHLHRDTPGSQMINEDGIDPWCFIFWITRDPQANYRELYHSLQQLPPSQTWIIDSRFLPSRSIEHDIPGMVYAAARAFKAEAIIPVSGPELTNQVCNFARKRGFPAMGPVFDS